MVVYITETLCDIHFTRLYAINIEPETTILTTVTSNGPHADEWVRSAFQANHELYYTNRLIVGIATQSSPSGNLHAATLQLCIGNFCLIYHFSRCLFDAEVLRSFLASPAVTFVGLSNMISTRLGQAPNNLVMQDHMPLDLGQWATNHGLLERSAPRIAREYLGNEIEDWDMAAEMSDWEAFTLNVVQVKHACLAAFVAYSFGVKICAYRYNPNLIVNGSN